MVSQGVTMIVRGGGSGGDHMTEIINIVVIKSRASNSNDGVRIKTTIAGRLGQKTGTVTYVCCGVCSSEKVQSRWIVSLPGASDV